MNDTKSLQTETPQNPHAATKDVAAGDFRRERIAVAAYHLAAARGFAPDHEIDDWLEAERAFDAQPDENVPHIGNSVSTDEYQPGPKAVAGVKDLRTDEPPSLRPKPSR
jgi:Protein of unknown function (DUF2934)